MAINKRKVLDAARKHAQKGAKQKALKEYEKLLAADPRDAKLHLEVGDAHRRWGQVEEAISQYTRVAAQFRQDGFDARAVAVYKQILNLDAKRFETHVELGELYQHMGLDSEAIGSLQTAADGYHKEGNKPKALELLRKMAALDPSNTTSRMKVADLLKQEGMEDEAAAEYNEVAIELKRQGETDNVPQVLERILEIRPDSADALSALAECYLELDRADRAEPLAVRLVDVAPDAENYERLCNIYRSLGHDDKLAEATKALAAVFRERGDEDQAREIMQRLPTEAVIGNSGLGQDRSEMEEPVLSDDQLLEDDEFLLGDGDLGSGEELSLDDPADSPSGVPKLDPLPSIETPAVPDEVVEEELPEGDPDQLLAEASVYLRYGKTAQAIVSLKGILAQDPDHRGALEKLGEAQAEDEEEADAVANWCRAAELAVEAGDARGFEILRDRISALDPDAAGELVGPEAAAEEASADLAPDVDVDVDLDDADGFDLELDVDIDVDPASETDVDENIEDDSIDLEIDLGEGGEGLEGAINEAADAADDAAEEGVELEDEDAAFEIEVDVDDDLEAALAEASAELDVDQEEEEQAEDDAGDAESSVDIDIDLDDSEFEIDVDVDEEAEVDLDLDLEEDPIESEGHDEVAVDSGTDSSRASQSTLTAAQVKEDLEEAEFYLNQDLFDEAEALYRRVLEVAPGHPSAMLRLGEIAAQKGADPSSADAASDDLVVEGDDLDEAVLDMGLDEEPDVAGDAAPDVQIASARKKKAVVDEAEDVDLAFADDTEDSTEVAELGAVDALANETTTNPLLAQEMADAALPDVTEPTATASVETIPDIVPDEDEVPEPVAAAAENGAGFDLAAELADVFDDDDQAPASDDTNETSAVLSSVDDGFESIFSDFKKGVSKALDEGDYETRYDLGIAYREMGLFDDAIAEFRVCLDSESRKFESLHLMGLSAYDLGRFADAVNHLEQALASTDLDAERKVGVYFDLGRAHEASGDAARALSAYREVQSVDTSFPGIEERVAAVESGESVGTPALAGDANENFESFDDLFSDDSSGGQEEAEEAFESFDDVITDVEAEAQPAETGDDVEVDAEPAQPEPKTEPKAKAKRGKKKISFV